MENKIYTFDDLVFNQHPNHGYQPGAVQAVLTLDNNVEVSVVGGDRLYGDGVETFEIAAFDSLGKFIKLGLDDAKCCRDNRNHGQTSATPGGGLRWPDGPLEAPPI